MRDGRPAQPCGNAHRRHTHAGAARRLGGSAARRLGGSAARRTIVTTPSSAAVKGRRRTLHGVTLPDATTKRLANPSRTRTNPAHHRMTLAPHRRHGAPPAKVLPPGAPSGPRQSSHIPSPPTIIQANTGAATMERSDARAARSPVAPPPGSSDRRGEPRMPAAGRTSAAGRSSESAPGGLGLFLDRVRKRDFHHRLRGVGPLDRSPWVTARTASRKSGIGAGRARKNEFKSVRWCSLPRTRCPRSRETRDCSSDRRRSRGCSSVCKNASRGV